MFMWSFGALILHTRISAVRVWTVSGVGMPSCELCEPSYIWSVDGSGFRTIGVEGLQQFSYVVQ